LLTLSPVSNCHLEPSTGAPAGALNSSANVTAATPTSGAEAPLAGLTTVSPRSADAVAVSSATDLTWERSRVDFIVTTDIVFCCP
jgi:hypothetical protein